MNYHNHNHWRFWHKGWGIAAGVVIALVSAVVLAFVFGYFVQLLWNWLMPALFNLGKIDYWQGFGIILLARLIFGSFGHGGNHRHWKRMEYYRRPGDWENDWDWGSGDDWRIKGGYRQWKYYRDYWREEGKAAFENYLERKHQSEEPKQEEKK